MEQSKLVGREIEQELLKEILQSNEAELVAVYGRRRVGKTYLIRQYFKKKMVFDFSGQINGLVEDQLVNFNQKLGQRIGLAYPIVAPANWQEAFNRLRAYLEPKVKKQKSVVFFDEFPWIDSHKSGFLSAFDYFWNDWASQQKNLKVIICGSAASWMIRKVISNRGGLHNGVTRKIRLLPFTLHETEAYLKYRKVKLEPYQIAKLYMVMGGIPHYLKELRRGGSFEQAIDRICFTKDGLLRNEFKELYGSLFHKFENHLAVVKSLSTKREGLTRSEIIEKSKLSSGGTTSLVLQELEESGFIMGYVPYDKNKKGVVYKLIDEFTVFYFKFIENKRAAGPGTWIKESTGSSWKSWSGFAFEALCHKHISQIKNALGLSVIHTEISAWRAKDEAQIDLLIDRADHCINMCEMKFYDGEFTVDKKYAQELRRKAQVFRERTATRKSIFTTIVTTFGVKENEYKLNGIQSVVVLKDLFKP